MGNTKPVQVVMLPTEDNTKIFYHKLSGKIGWTEVSLKIRHARISQHLYFISTDPNEEIKEGDLVLIKEPLGLVVCKVHNPENFKGEPKIIASSDPIHGLPAIPLTWIRDVYVQSNGSIKEVKLKMIGVDKLHRYDSSKDPNADVFEILKLTPDNEVVIVGRNIDKLPYPELVKEISEYYKDVKVVENSVDQELEDAAKKSVGEIEDMAGMAGYNGFKKGADWRAEQSANDAIEFMRWTRSQSCGYVVGGDNRNRKLNTTGFITDQELYELWKQSKKK